MISTKKLIKMARKWQQVAALKRKNISLPRARRESNTLLVADKGHFVVYTMDERRYSFPIAYLNSPVIRQLFEMSEKEFGLPSDGPIRLPCDAIFMEYVISLIKKHAAKEIEAALLVSMATGCCLPVSDLHREQSHCQSLICSIWRIFLFVEKVILLYRLY